MCGPSMFGRHTVLALGVSILVLLLNSTDSATPRTLIAKVERVSDGDTVTAITDNRTKLRLRLLGIDAVEFAHGNIPSLACPD